MRFAGGSEVAAADFRVRESEGFGSFLRIASVFRQPVPAEDLALFGTDCQIQRSAGLTLLERETRPDGDTFWVHPMIR